MPKCESVRSYSCAPLNFNFLFSANRRFHLGAPTDYDEWASKDLEGSEGWAFSYLQKLVRPFFL